MKRVFLLLSVMAAGFANAMDYTASSIEEANKLLNTSKPADRVILRDGVYKDAIIKFTNNGIAFLAEHAGKVFFQENSTLGVAGEKNTIEGFVWQLGGKGLDTKSVIEFKNGKDMANHCVLSNCSIEGYNTADLNVDNKWISLYGTYNTVTHCLLKDKFNRGATLTVWLDGSTPAHHTISYNYFLNRQNGPDVDNGLESIRIGDSKTSFTPAHCTVAFNRFEKCDGEIEIISNKSCHNTYLHNTFVDNDGGLTLRHGNDCLADGNFFDGADKPKSYGVRFIGEGHMAINNYFFHLNGSPSQAFRAPVTLVNGLVNTPINGYFQVRRAVVSDNIFVNCITPNIRIGAYSKRDGMTVSPDTVLIRNNIMYDDAGKVGQVYEELTAPMHLTIQHNKIMGEYLKADRKGFEAVNNKGSKRDGFDWIKDGKGNIIASADAKAVVTDNPSAGADWTEPAIANEAKKRKYTYLSAQEVGPDWLKQ
jgi:poly(beta-D-mannuronate) lyase